MWSESQEAKREDMDRLWDVEEEHERVEVE